MKRLAVVFGLSFLGLLSCTQSKFQHEVLENSSQYIQEAPSKPNEDLSGLTQKIQDLKSRIKLILDQDFKEEHICWDLGSLAADIQALNSEARPLGAETPESHRFWSEFQKYSPQIINSLLFGSRDFSVCPLNATDGIKTDFENLFLPWLDQILIGVENHFLSIEPVQLALTWKELLANIEMDIGNLKNLIESSEHAKPLSPEEMKDQEFYNSAWAPLRAYEMARIDISGLNMKSKEIWKKLSDQILNLKQDVFSWKGDYASAVSFKASLEKILEMSKAIKAEDNIEKPNSK